jgi:hypothetical protein
LTHFGLIAVANPYLNPQLGNLIASDDNNCIFSHTVSTYDTALLGTHECKSVFFDFLGLFILLSFWDFSVFLGLFSEMIEVLLLLLLLLLVVVVLILAVLCGSDIKIFNKFRTPSGKTFLDVLSIDR